MAADVALVARFAVPPLVRGVVLAVEPEMARQEVDDDDGGNEGDEVGGLDPGGGGGGGAAGGVGEGRGAADGRREGVVLPAHRHSESVRKYFIF